MFELYILYSILGLALLVALNFKIRVKLNGKQTNNIIKRFIISFFVVGLIIGLPVWVIGRVILSFV